MNKIKIFVACHKPGPVRHDDVYTPIHVGRAISKYKDDMADMIGDDTGDNISEKNPMYCEMTAQYWAWKNVHDVEYIGFCHYRRFFNICLINNVDSLFHGYDVVLAKKRNVDIAFKTIPQNVSLEDLTIFLMVLKKLYPEYEKTVIDYLWGNKKYICNMIICGKELFDQYAGWLFSILEECEKYMRKSPYSRGLRALAYLSEIFMGVYFLHNHMRIKEARIAGWNSGMSFIIKDILKTIEYYIIKPIIIIKKPCSFEEMYDRAVLVGLKNDGIIPIGE